MTTAPVARSGAAPAPWWASVSPRELAASGGMISGLSDPAPDAPGENATALARALAIQQLFAQETLLEDLLAQAIERVRAYARVEASADLTAANAWLTHCALLEQVFGQCVDMLGRDRQQAAGAALDAFVMHVALLRRHLIGAAVSRGIDRDISAPPPATVRRRRPI